MNESYWAVLSCVTCSVLHFTADEMLKCDQHFRDVQFIMLSKVVLRFESVDRILEYFYSNDGY